MALPLPAVLVAALGAALVSFLLGRLLTRHAPDLGLQDLPNARSSHQTPRPRGGGVGIVLAFLLALPFAVPLATFGTWNVWLPLVAAVTLALVGLADDLRGLGLATRLVAQSFAVAALLAALAGSGGGVLESDTGLFARVADLAVVAPQLSADLAPWLLVALDALLIPVLLLAALWWINLFNFMDGIDGLAASQALFMLIAALVVKLSAPGNGIAHPEILSATESVATLMLAAAVAGFLVLNWPPSRIFMGDAGSLFLGFSILALASHDVTLGHMNTWTWLILGTLFLVDATTTLLRRWLTRQHVTTAHRSHLYQRLSRRWGSHRRVTLVYFLLNVTLVFPLAFLAHHAPQWAPVVLVVAWLPAAVVAWHAGAGLKET